jgi:hypothetical protein
MAIRVVCVAAFRCPGVAPLFVLSSYFALSPAD